MYSYDQIALLWFFDSGSQRDDLLLLEKDNEIINIFGVKKSTTLLQSKNNNILITLREKK